MTTQTVRGFAAAERTWNAPARQYYRCQDCLAVVAVDGSRTALETGWGLRGAACGICGGRMEHLGQVGADHHRLVKLSERSVCDDRCTMARGPSCECQCGGENHGSHLVVVVTTDAGARPTITPAGDASKHLAAVAAFRETRASVETQIDALYGAAMRAKTSGWVDGATFRIACEGQRVRHRYHEVLAMRSHAGRNAALRVMAQELTP